jgi:TetR/AcrR family transcriptional regulator, regulator of cefoperazone and chloramphenicol sensitivity
MDEPDARTRLREMALDLFGRQGVAATSTREILAAAGMRNPSAISYHFGSKAGLVDDLVAELYEVKGPPMLRRQVELGEGPEPPSVEAWAAIPVANSAELVTTERGCLLARLLWEYDGYLRPNVFEEYLAGESPFTARWIAAAVRTLPDLPRYVAVARNLTMLRTLEWMMARRAGRILAGQPPGGLWIHDAESFRQMMQEAAVGILGTPTKLSGRDQPFGP